MEDNLRPKHIFALVVAISSLLLVLLLVTIGPKRRAYVSGLPVLT